MRHGCSCHNRDQLSYSARQTGPSLSHWIQNGTRKTCRCSCAQAATADMAESRPPLPAIMPTWRKGCHVPPATPACSSADMAERLPRAPRHPCLQLRSSAVSLHDASDGIVRQPLLIRPGNPGNYQLPITLTLTLTITIVRQPLLIRPGNPGNYQLPITNYIDIDNYNRSPATAHTPWKPRQLPITNYKLPITLTITITILHQPWKPRHNYTITITIHRQFALQGGSVHRAAR
jgi:hypothetical protein